MLVDLFNKEGEKAGQINLPEEIFGLKLNRDLVHQVTVSELANKRKNIAHTKNRSEVRGGGKKPWSQKGLGRARHGSIRSPIWKGGGVVFGPKKEKIFYKKIPKKMKAKVLFMLLSEKARNNLIFVFDDLKIEKPKTKIFFELIKKWMSKIENFKKRSVLVLVLDFEKNLKLAARNIEGVKVMMAKDLNLISLLSFRYLILSKQSLELLEKKFLNK